jgi:alkanesulfonate monooxygenase SsuD/methylene tetrahydromethanopterin reductase-like flavin-dependent oxidoreductase (luciferase family)
MAAPLAIVGIGAAAAGAVTGAFGSYESGQAQKAAYTYQAGVASINAQIARQNADYAIAAGETAAQQQAMKVRATIGSTRAAQGASGIDVNTGTSVDVRASEADIGSEDIAITRNEALRKAYGYQVEGMQYETQSTLDKYAATNAAFAGDIGAVTSILGGASSVSTKWQQASQAGIAGFGAGGSPVAPGF